MSRAAAKLNARSRQGKIRADNPELFSLLGTEEELASNSVTPRSSRPASKVQEPVNQSRKPSAVSQDPDKGSLSGRTSGKKVAFNIQARSPPIQTSGGQGRDISDSGRGAGSESGQPIGHSQHEAKGRTVEASSMQDGESVEAAKNGNPEGLASKEGDSGDSVHQPGASVNWDSEDFDNNKNLGEDSAQTEAQKPIDNGGEKKEGTEQLAGEGSAQKVQQSQDYDRETLWSASSELGRLKSPSRKSLNDGDGKTPPPSSPLQLAADDPDKARTETRGEASEKGEAVFTPRREVGGEKHGGTAPISDHKSGSLDKDDDSTPTNEGGRKHSSILNQVNQQADSETNAGSAEREDITPIADEARRNTKSDTAPRKEDENKLHLNLEPTQSRASPSLPNSTSGRPTPAARSSAYGANSVSSSLDTSLNLAPQQRFTGPYSSQRLKARGDTAKRPTAASVSTVGDVTARSLDSTYPDVDASDAPTDSLEVKQQGAGESISLDSLDVVRDSLDVENSAREDQTGQVADITGERDENENKASEDKNRDISSEKRVQSARDLSSVQEVEKNLPAPEQREASDPTDREAQSRVGQEDRVEFVIKPDPNKQGVSRYSSAQGSGRFSSRNSPHSSRRTSLVNAELGSAAGGRTVNSVTNATPSSNKRILYVESPTFTREEEEEYRFVSSRLDDVEEEDTSGLGASGQYYFSSAPAPARDRQQGRGRASRGQGRGGEGHSTYRELDMAAIQYQRQEPLPHQYQQQQQQQPRYQQQPPQPQVPTGGAVAEKRVRYSDMEPPAPQAQGRFEDKDYYGQDRIRIGGGGPGFTGNADASADATQNGFNAGEDFQFPLGQFTMDTYGNRPGIPVSQQSGPPSVAPPQTNTYSDGAARRDSGNHGYAPGHPRNQPQVFPPGRFQQDGQNPRHSDPSQNTQNFVDSQPNVRGGGVQAGYDRRPQQQGHSNTQSGNATPPPYGAESISQYSQQPHGYHQLRQQQHPGDGYSQQFMQGIPLAQQKPHYQQQQQVHHYQQQNHQNQQPQQQQQQQQQQQPQQPPVKGLVLPTGPSYDPVDEEDLQRETTYQQSLRSRIEEVKKQTEETIIPRKPVPTPMNDPTQGYPYQGQGRPRYVPGSQDFAQDSLENYENENGRYVSQDLHGEDILQQHQALHPVNHFRGYGGPGGLQQQPLSRSRLDNVQLDSDDFGQYEEDYDDAYGDARRRRNPHVQPRFFDPALAAAVSVNNYSNNSTNRNQQQQQQPPFTDRSNYDDNDVEGRYQDENVYDGGGGRGGQGGGGGGGRVGTAQSDYMEATHPKPPKYDYVSHNKEDYGKAPQRSYKQIMEIQREEKEKLNEVFIHPKPKGGGILKKRRPRNGNGEGNNGSRQESVYSGDGSSYYAGDGETPGLEDGEGMTAAEQVWAQRSSQLAHGGGRAKRGGRGGARPGPGGLQRFHSDSSVQQAAADQRRESFQPRASPQHQQQHQQQQQQKQQQQQQRADKRAFMTDLPTPVNDQLNNQVAVPLSPRHGEIQLQPIHQQIVTEDGQRISVDVNLRLISPPDIAGGSNQQQQPQQQQQQQQQGAYGGRARQYPAEPQFSQQQDLLGDYSDVDPEGMPRGDYRYISPRNRYSADEALRQLSESRTELNPYGKVPPIDDGRSWLYRDDDHPSSAPILDQGGSYMDVYRRQRENPAEKPWYKVYGLRDYRRMQKEVKLGTLGPDLDSDATRERREKAQRQQDYAKVVMERNKVDMHNRKPPMFPRPKENNDIMNRRKLAQEYAKSVPKPTVKVRQTEFNSYELASEKSPIAKHHRNLGSTGTAGGMSLNSAGNDGGANQMLSPSPQQRNAQDRGRQKDMEVINLEKLRQRYEQDKQNEAAIRQTSGTTY